MSGLYVARATADIVCDLVDPRDQPRIREITVVVGELSGIVADYLEFCLEAVSTEYSIPSTPPAIQHVPLWCYCKTTGFLREKGKGDLGFFSQLPVSCRT